jgi:pyrroline-5-carboxylate reductase
VSTTTIGFIGGGNMAEAILKGLLASGTAATAIRVSEPLAARRQYLTEAYGIACSDDNNTVVAASTTVVLAIKPQMAAEVLPQLTAAFSADKLLVSILAGAPTTRLATLLGQPARIIRAMPNTPALIGAGATALAAGSTATAADLATAEALFAAVGTVCTVTEAQMDAVTAVSGSGPAYIFTVIDAMVAGGVAEGLDPDTALALAIQTVVGSARLVAETGEAPLALRQKVCSPGGTTLAAIEKLDALGFAAALTAGVRRAAERSRELG